MKPTILDTEFYVQYVRHRYTTVSSVPKITFSMRVTAFWENEDVPYELAVASFLAHGKIREHGDVLTPRQLQRARKILIDCGEDEEMINSVLRILGGSPDCTETERICHLLLADTVLYHHIINHSVYTEWPKQSDNLRTPQVRMHLMTYAEKKRRDTEEKPEKNLGQNKDTGSIIRPEFVEKACHMFLDWKANCPQEPSILWENLQKFASCPIDADEDDLLWEVYPKGNSYRTAFVRQYSRPEEDEYFQLHIECAISPDKPLSRETLWSFDCSDWDAFFARIEQSSAFRVFLAESSVTPKIYIDET